MPYVLKDHAGNNSRMPYHYKFNKLAQKEFEDALQWYVDRSEKAAIGFVEAMDFPLESVYLPPDI
jgi:hypothetical protein